MASNAAREGGPPGRPLPASLVEAAAQLPDPELGTHPTVAELVASVAATGARRLIERDPGVRRDEDPEDVHQARVATRRLRADLKSLEPVLDTDWTDHVRSELRWLGGVLGEVRDLDVLEVHLRREFQVLTERDQRLGSDILALMAAQRTARLDQLLDVLSSTRYQDLLDELVLAAERPPLGPDVRATKSGRKLLRKVSATAWRRTEKAARRLDDDAPLAEVHELRKRVKRARYAAQLSAPVLGTGPARLASRLGDLQDDLGELNDAVTLAAWLDDAAPEGLDPPAAYLAGRLAERQEQVIEEHRASWPTTWSRIRRRDLSWMER